MLRYIFIITLLFFIACSDNTKKEKKNIKSEKKVIHKNKTKIFKIKDCNLTFINNKLIYPKRKIYILFYDSSKFSKIQEEVLKYLKIKYYKTNNEFLKNYFKIKMYPTIVILDKNKTIKFENFTPIEILKGF